VAELPAYTGASGVCAKCGCSDAESAYHQGVPDIHWAGGEAVFVTRNDDARDCMVRACRNCEYAWVEGCAERR